MHARILNPRLYLLVTSLLVSTAEPAAAQSLGEALKGFLHDDATATIHLRSFYMDRTNVAPPNYVAWAGGGWIGYQSGWLYDTLQIGAVGYTTQPLWAPPSTSGTQLLKTGQYGFFTLGQAYASARWQGQTFTGFRQIIDELEVNPNDDRMIPLTFEAYALRGKLGPVNYFAGYVAAIKPKESSAFINMAERAGAPNVNAGSIDDLRLRASAYHVPDILTSSYGDIVKTVTITDDLKVRLAANLMVQGSNGLNLLTGRPFSTWSAGGRTDLLWKEFGLWGAYTQTGSAAAYRAPYGQWIGYTKQITLDFDRANERAFQVGITYDFAGIGIPGLAFLASGTFGSGAIDAMTSLPLAQNNEYDFDLTYQVAAKSAPWWLKPLQLRARMAHVDQSFNGVHSQINEYRLIVNYELNFKGFRR
jgi:outer membrane porin, OprD family